MRVRHLDGFGVVCESKETGISMVDERSDVRARMGKGMGKTLRRYGSG